MCMLTSAGLQRVPCLLVLCLRPAATRHNVWGTDQVWANKTSGMVQSWNKFCFTGGDLCCLHMHQVLAHALARCQPWQAINGVVTLQLAEADFLHGRAAHRPAGAHTRASADAAQHVLHRCSVYAGCFVATFVWRCLGPAGGFVEFSVRLPGNRDQSGFWAATWLMGNLGRAGYYPSLEGMWPFSYDSCDSGDQAHSWNDNKTQRISRCYGKQGDCQQQ
jgi:hypothetical protein